MENEMRNHSLRICLIIFLLICITANASAQVPVSVLEASKSITMNDAKQNLPSSLQIGLRGEKSVPQAAIWQEIFLPFFISYFN